MALTRKFLSALGIEDDKIDEIISAHTDTVNGLKDEIEKQKSLADKLPDVQKELSEKTTALERLQSQIDHPEESPYKKDFEELTEKYQAMEKEFTDYKADIEAKDALAKKTDAYKKLLLDSGVSEKRIDSVIKVSDIDSIEFDDDGKIKGADDLAETIKSEWADFIVDTHETGARTPNPPDGGGAGKGESRAAQLAAQYHANLYGSSKEE